jgi:hypothetical protein
MIINAMTINILAGLLCLCVYLLCLWVKNLSFEIHNLLQSFVCGPGIVTGVLIIANELFKMDSRYVINKEIAVVVGGIVLSTFAIIQMLKITGTISDEPIKSKNNRTTQKTI